MSLMFALITNLKSGLFSSLEFYSARSRIEMTSLCSRSISSKSTQTSYTQVEIMPMHLLLAASRVHDVKLGKRRGPCGDAFNHIA